MKSIHFQSELQIQSVLLDDVTQDPNMPSYVRTQLWQAVSKLESIRE